MRAKEPLVLYRRASVRLRRAALADFALVLKERVTAGRAFCCLVTDDRELRRLNRRFLGRDYATDVLSFPLHPTTSGRPAPVPAVRLPEPPALGELAISVQRAREQARAFGHSVEDEIRILMLHGVLHLAGMNHERDGGRMARAEARWSRKLGLPSGLVERVIA